jgi:hypothetical protein
LSNVAQFSVQTTTSTNVNILQCTNKKINVW